MELGWIDNYDSIGALILAPGTGETGMEALGEILKGDVNPSGKTVDTYVYDLTATPNYNNTGNFAYSNVDDLKEAFTEADDAYQGWHREQEALSVQNMRTAISTGGTGLL